MSARPSSFDALQRAALALALAASLAACGTAVRNPVTGQTERTVMDERAEIAEGAKAHPQILKEYGVVANPALSAYVDRVGQKLASMSHRRELKWTFTVLDSPEINAFALPGGYVYVTRGIMAHLDSEADLAGVLGHEIGHVTARHGAQRATQQQSAGLWVLGATVLGSVFGSAGAAAAQDISATLLAGRNARYSREHELQADQLGAEYLARTRYNPNNMIDVIQVLLDQERFAADAARAAGRAPPSGPGWLASHPSSEQRLTAIRGTSETLARTQPAWEDDGRTRYLQALAGLTYGDGREHGVVRGRTFYHEPLGIALTAPQGWRIVNDSDRVLVINGERNAGLVMRLVPEEAIKKIGSAEHEAILRQGLGATEGRSERLTLGGSLAATHFSGQRRDSRGQVSPLDITVVSGPANQVFLLGWSATDAQALQRARPALREAELSLRPLTSADRAAAKPWTVRLVPMPAGGFAQLARSSPLTELPEQQLRLLNGAYHGGAAGAAGNSGKREPRTGELVKIVE
jgi:predicted Zn-dependent protease